MDETTKTSNEEKRIKLTPAMKVAFLVGVFFMVSATNKMLDAQIDVITVDRYVLAYMIAHTDDSSAVETLKEYRECTAFSLNPLKSRQTVDECRSAGRGAPQALFDEVDRRTKEAMEFAAPGMQEEVYSGVKRMLWGLPFILFLFFSAAQQRRSS